jgi:hypothetical protein
MTVKELIEILQKLPEETKIFIDEDAGLRLLSNESVEYCNAYLIHYSGYNGDNIPHEGYSLEPMEGSYVYHFRNGDLVEEWKTLSSEFVLVLGW